MALPSTALLLSIAAFATRALAHDHHGESSIPEGETVSLEPIVREVPMPLSPNIELTRDRIP